MEKKRILWLDCAKGVGILLVVIGHTIIAPIRNESYIMNFIYSSIYYFHMPFMMFLSGISYEMFKKEQMAIRIQIKNKIQQLLIPYITYSILVVFLVWVLSLLPFIGGYISLYGSETISLRSILMEIIIGGNTYAIHLWYIYALFLFYLFRITTDKILNNYQHVLIGVVLFAIKCVFNTDDLYIINSVCTLYFWFALGSCIKLHQSILQLFKSRTMLKWFFMFISYGYVIVDILYIPTWNNPALYTLHTIVKFIFIYILLCSIIASCMRSGNLGSRLAALGRKSYSIYLFHQPFICLCGVTVLNFFLPSVVAVVIGVIMSICIPYFIIERLLELRYMRIIRVLLKGR